MAWNIWECVNLLDWNSWLSPYHQTTPPRLLLIKMVFEIYCVPWNSLSAWHGLIHKNRLIFKHHLILSTPCSLPFNSVSSQFVSTQETSVFATAVNKSMIRMQSHLMILWVQHEEWSYFVSPPTKQINHTMPFHTALSQNGQWSHSITLDIMQCLQVEHKALLRSLFGLYPRHWHCFLTGSIIFHELK